MQNGSSFQSKKAPVAKAAGGSGMWLEDGSEQSEEYIEDSADNQDWKQKSQSNGKQQEEQQETRQGDPCAQQAKSQ